MHVQEAKIALRGLTIPVAWSCPARCWRKVERSMVCEWKPKIGLDWLCSGKSGYEKQLLQLALEVLTE